jgi:hypothetical protein
MIGKRIGSAEMHAANSAPRLPLGTTPLNPIWLSQYLFNCLAAASKLDHRNQIERKEL